MITQERLKELFTYDGESLIWKTVRPGRSTTGAVAGWVSPSNNYIYIGVDTKMYRAHRLIFLYCHGYLPKTLDHIDGDRANNQIENLRACTVQQNNQNAKISRANNSGIKGVIWDKNARLWRARIRVNYKEVSLGCFWDKETARQVVRIERIKHHGKFANHG